MGKTLSLVISLIFLGHAISQTIDITLQEKSKGKDCVKAVDDKIRLSNIFSNDHRFLLRTAFVETKFGNDESTYATTTSGGIWKISTIILEATKIISNATAEIKDKINTTFNIKWEDVNITDLHKPLYSGLAMKIFLAGLNLPIPASIGEQATFWTEKVNTAGLIQNFTADVTELEEDIPCLGRMKLVLALDKSRDVGVGNFQTMKTVAASVVSELDTPNVPMGVLVYAVNASAVFDFDKKLNSTQRTDAISNATYIQLGDGTSTHSAIDDAVTMIKEGTLGIPPSIPNILVVFTKGKLDNLNATETAAKNAADNGITIFACGFDNGRIDNLLVIAQNNPNQVIGASSMLFFKEAPYLITERMCSVPQTADTKSLMSGKMKKGDVQYFSYKVPSDGINMAVETTSGNIEAYYSFSFPTPSSAIHDGVLSKESIKIPQKEGATEMIVSLKALGDDINDFRIKTSFGFILKSSFGVVILSTILSCFY